MNFLRILAATAAVFSALLLQRAAFAADSPQPTVGGFVQGDGRFFLRGPGRDGFAVRRARLDVRAVPTRFLRVRLHADFADSTLSLLDAYGTLAPFEELALQVGKMKSPIGLELLQSSRDMSFPERGLPSSLVPNRDVGAVLLGDLRRGTLSYTLGVFNGVADGASGDGDANDEQDLEARVFAQPFTGAGIDALAGLGVGVAGSIGEQTGALPAYRTPGRQTFLRYAETASAAGQRTRISPQGYYYYGPLGVLAEYVRSVQQVSDGTDTITAKAHAWQLWGSIVIGGSAGYKGAKVDAPLDPAAGGWGALEIAARYGELRIGNAGLVDPSTAARRARNLGLSLSYWFANGSRAMVGFDRTSVRGPAPVRIEHLLVTRLQVAL